jgi:hypothetical protein
LEWGVTPIERPVTDGAAVGTATNEHRGRNARNGLPESSANCFARRSLGAIRHRRPA